MCPSHAAGWESGGHAGPPLRERVWRMGHGDTGPLPRCGEGDVCLLAAVTMDEKRRCSYVVDASDV